MLTQRDSMTSVHFMTIGSRIRHTHLRIRSRGRRRFRPSRDVISAFDAAWYARAYPDVAQCQADPIVHYLATGWHEGRRPNPVFDPAAYLRRYPDVARAGIEPLTHYAMVGWHEGRDPITLFSTRWYLETQVDKLPPHVDPLTHYLLAGWREGISPHPIFDGRWYANEHRDLIPDDTAPLVHYLDADPDLCLNPSSTFDARWYRRQRTPDVLPQTTDAEHYLLHGALVDASPNPLFDPKWYRTRYMPDADPTVTPWTHYCSLGARAGHAPSLMAADHTDQYTPERDHSALIRAAERAQSIRTLEGRAHLDASGTLHLEATAGRLAVIACSARNGILSAATLYLARSFKAAGFTVVVTCDAFVNWGPVHDADAFDVIVTSDHQGYDFYSWRMALEQIALALELRSAAAQSRALTEVVFMNDSVIGPLDDDLGRLLDTWRALPFDVCGLVESAVPEPHIQSWAIRFSGPAADIDELLTFYRGACPQTPKHQLITTLEIPLGAHFKRRGFTVGSLVSPSSTPVPMSNPMVDGWRAVSTHACRS